MFRLLSCYYIVFPLKEDPRGRRGGGGAVSLSVSFLSRADFIDPETCIHTDDDGAQPNPQLPLNKETGLQGLKETLWAWWEEQGCRPGLNPSIIQVA